MEEMKVDPDKFFKIITALKKTFTSLENFYKKLEAFTNSPNLDYIPDKIPLDKTRNIYLEYSVYKKDVKFLSAQIRAILELTNGIKKWISNDNYNTYTREGLLDCMLNLVYQLDIDEKYFSDFINDLISDNELYYDEQNNMIYLSEETMLPINDYIIRYYLEHGDDGSEISNKFKELYSDYTMCDYSGKFENFTDWQEIFLPSMTNSIYDAVSKYDCEGMTISEILDLYDFSSNPVAYSTLLKCKAYGMGELKITEFMDDSVLEDVKAEDFNGIVFSDVDNNFQLSFGCTKNSSGDITYDAFSFLEFIGDKYNSDSIKKLLKKLSEINTDDVFGYEIQTSSDNYRALVEFYAKKYADKASENDKKVNSSGYSLGGSLTQYAGIYLLNNYPSQLGNITTFNGLNANLSEEDFNSLKALGQDRFSVYSCQGDFVSKFVAEEYLKDYYINLDTDWETGKKYDLAKAEIDDKFDDNNFLNSILSFFFNDDFNTVYKYSSATYKGCYHDYSEGFKSSSFDKNTGKATSVEPVSLEQCSEKLFGLDLMDFIYESMDEIDLFCDIGSFAIDTGKTIVAAKEYAYENYHIQEIIDSFGEKNYAMGGFYIADVAVQLTDDIIDNVTDKMTEWSGSVRDSAKDNFDSDPNFLTGAAYAGSCVMDGFLVGAEFVIDEGSSLFAAGSSFVCDWFG